MRRFKKKRKEEIGLAPDAFIFRGDQKEDYIGLRVIDFDSTNMEDSVIESIKEVVKYKDKNTVTWLNVDGLHDLNLMREISRQFEIEPIVIADVMHTEARPKVQEYDNCIFISLKMLQQEEGEDRSNVENLSIIITDSILISFQEKKGDVFEPVRDRIRKQKKRIRNSGTDYLAYALLDIVIDNYIYVLGTLGEKIEALEEELIAHPTHSIIQEINADKQELNHIRRNIIPAKEMILALSKIESDLIDDTTDLHLKELQDNINHAIESSDSYREILSDLLNIYHTSISSKLNDIMKFLTIFSVIFIPLTFIAGIYGTNFEFLPELKYRYSYFIMLAVMIVLTIGMLIYFRKKKWF